jgi:dTDP-4-dehydrorhamnose 3,5-epimerase-like enzyme
MAKLLQLQTFSDYRGNLSVLDRIEDILPFKISRVFYIYGVDQTERGGHRHKKTYQAAICINGSCIVETDNGSEKGEFLLDSSNKCLLIPPEDWHIMKILNKEAVFIVFASECYDPKDYIFEPYANNDRV